MRLTKAEKNARAFATGHLMGDLGRWTARGGAIRVSAQLVKMILQLGTLAVLARLLAPEDFGLVAMAVAVTGLVGIFTDLGLSAATVQRAELDQDTVSTLFLVNLAMGVLVMATVIALAPAAAWFFDDPRVRWVVTALAVPIPLLAASRQHAALLQRGMRWIAIEWTGIAAQLVAAGVAIFIAWRTDLGYWALVAQGWVSAMLTLILLWSVCPWRPSRVRNWRNARSALSFGMHLTGANFLNYLDRNIDNVLIGWKWGAIELGYYTRAYSVLKLPLTVLSNPVSSAVIPALSRLQDQPERWRRTFLEAQGALLLGFYGLAAALIAVAEPFIAILLGPGWSKASEIFFYLSFAMFPSAIANTMGWSYISLGRTDRMLQWGLIRFPILLVAFLLGLPYGAPGVAIGFACAAWASLWPCVWFATRHAPVSSGAIFKRAAAPFALGLIAASFGLWMRNAALPSDAAGVELIVGVGAVLALYLPGCYIILAVNGQYASLRTRLHSAFLHARRRRGGEPTQ